MVWSYCSLHQISSNDYKTSYFQNKFDGDTVINGNNYKKLYASSDCFQTQEYLAAMRETNKQIFAIFPDQEEQTEVLLYDFNLQEGDVIHSYYTSLDYTVTKIDSIEIAGYKRKIFNIGNSFEQWIEGIGTIHNRPLLYSLSGIISENTTNINYQKKEGEIIYKTDEWFFNEDECIAIPSKEWFPIGAKWYYNYSYWDNKGYSVFEVVSDTIINDKLSKIVEQTGYIVPDEEGQKERHYFMENEGKIFYYKDDVYTLLYDFTLNVGDTFTLLKNNTDFSICDTMQYVIDSIKYDSNNFKVQYLHYTKFVCAYDLCGSFPEKDEQNVEYIGNTKSLFYEIGIMCDVAPPQYLRCYSDDDISLRFFIEPGVSCDTIITRINDKKIIQSDIKIFPNPVADIFNIDVSKADKKIKTIEILDMVGNCVYKTESIQPIISVNSSDYTKGMYIVRILFNDAYYQTFKILKYK